MRHARRLLIATSVPSTITAFLIPYVRHYKAKGWRVDAACNGGAADSRLLEEFDAVFHVPWTRRPQDPVNLTSAPRVLQNLVSTTGYDIVHLHDPIPGFVGRLALRGQRRRGRPRVVYTAHGFHFFEGASWSQNVVFRVLESAASRWTDRLVVINQEDLRAAKTFPIPENRVVYMPGIGVDTDTYSATSISDVEIRHLREELELRPSDVPVLMVAEFNPGKRHLDAVAAVAATGRPQLVLLLAGLGPQMDAVREHAVSLGIADRVRFLGYRNDIPILLKASIALLLPSEREGLPRSIMEALSSERPVIATRIRGITELVNESSGILTQIGDVHAIASALRTFVDDPELASEMGKSGRRAIKTFDIRNVIALHDRMYADMLSDESNPTDSTRGP